MRKKLLIVQYVLVSYRVNVFNELSKNFQLKVAASSYLDEANFDKSLVEFDFLKLKEFRFLNFCIQKGLFSLFLKERPDFLFLPFHPFYPQWFLLMLLARLTGCKVFLNYQGFYKVEKLNFLKKLAYKILFWPAHKYVGYTDLSVKTFIRFGFDPSKLEVAENTLTLKSVMPFEKKTELCDEVLFLGRIRAGSQIEKLLLAIQEINSSGRKCLMHIVGDGPDFSFFRSKFNQAFYKWHGGIYDESRIVEISKKCKVACYPGDSGLSIVHFFSLSLPVVTHKDFYPGFKGGPEASYIKDGFNGFLTSRFCSSSELAKKLLDTLDLPEQELRNLQKNSYETYLSLNKPSYAEKLTNIFLKNR